MAKENRKEQSSIYPAKSFNTSDVSIIEIGDHKNGSFTKPQVKVTKQEEKVITSDPSIDRSIKRSSLDRVDRIERKMFKAEQGGTFEWLAEKICSIQKAADAIGNLSPEFKGIIIILDK